WADHDLRDALRIVQTGVRPRLAAVGRFINSVTDGHAVSRPRLASSDPNVFCVLGIERNCANRLHRLFVEHRSVASSAVVRFPDASAGRAAEKRDLAGGLSRYSDRGDASAHCGGTDFTRAKPGEGCRIK